MQNANAVPRLDPVNDSFVKIFNKCAVQQTTEKLKKS